MPTQYLDHDPSSASYDIFQGLQKQISGKAEQLEKKKKIQEALQATLLEAALKNMQLKKGADLSKVDTSQGIQGVLGNLGNTFERKTVAPSISTSTTDRPYTDILKAREISSRTPQDYYKAGMATPGSRIGGTGFLGSGFGPGSKRGYNLSPGAMAEQAEAKGILGNPVRTTRRVSYKGDADLMGTEIANLPEPSE